MRRRLWTLPVLAVATAALLASPAQAQAPAAAEAPAAAAPASVVVDPAGLCHVTYTVVVQWPGGFVANVTVTNVSPTPVRWRVLIDYLGGEINQAWNVVATRTGSTWTFTRPPWLGSLDILLPGQSATFGIAGTGSGLPARVSVLCTPVPG